MDANIISIPDLSHIIQLAVAPVFLLAGIAGFLNVMSGRLGRIVDRARVVERRRLSLDDAAVLERLSREIHVLWRRIRLINWSIALCTGSGLMVCVLIVTLFGGSYWGINVGAGIVLEFVLALMLLIASLILFLKETQLATRTLKAGGEFVEVGDT
jgi:Protein of unknown function (DUF2721).